MSKSILKPNRLSPTHKNDDKLNYIKRGRFQKHVGSGSVICTFDVVNR